MRKLKVVVSAAAVVMTLSACGAASQEEMVENMTYVEPNIYTQLEQQELELASNPSSMHTMNGVGTIKFHLSSISSYSSLRHENDTENDEVQDTENEPVDADAIEININDSNGDDYQ